MYWLMDKVKSSRNDALRSIVCPSVFVIKTGCDRSRYGICPHAINMHKQNRCIFVQLKSALTSKVFKDCICEHILKFLALAYCT